MLAQDPHRVTPDPADEALNARIPIPAGATTDGWLSERGGVPERSLTWLDGNVSVVGWQDALGHVRRYISVDIEPCEEFDADEARLLAEELLAAVERLEELQQ